MTTQLVRITSEVEIPYLTYSGQSVLTFALIDKAHGRVEGTAKAAFQRNRKRFIENEDFYVIESKSLDAWRTEFPNFVGANAPNLTLITESGYLMVVKPFTDDRSWDIQRQLVKLYFRVKEIAEKQASSYESLSSHTVRAVQIGNSKAVNQTQVALGGADAAIRYNVKNCTLQSGKTPSEWKRIAKAEGIPAKHRDSGKDVLRVKHPQMACGMSLADLLIAGGASIDDGIGIGKDSQHIFQRILALGITPPELLI